MLLETFLSSDLKLAGKKNGTEISHLGWNFCQIISRQLISAFQVFNSCSNIFSKIHIICSILYFKILMIS